MTLNKQKGNMYPWVTHTWNPIKGRCPHGCIYCYMKGKSVGELRLDKKALKDNLGEGNVIFVGSSIDMWANEVPDMWIVKVLLRCNRFPKNTYLFQSKNPRRFIDCQRIMPKNKIIGTTIEPARDYTYSFYEGIVPTPKERVEIMEVLEMYNLRKMISIEPIMDFNLDTFVRWIKSINPEFVTIGADSKGHNLPEPSPEKIKALIKELSKFTEVKVKDNLKRLQ